MEARVGTTGPTLRTAHALPRRKLARNWRLGSESNRRTRSCSPLHNHSATEPYRVRTTLGDWSAKRRGCPQPGWRTTSNSSTFNAPKRQKGWSGKPGSNRRPQPWQGCALPTELFPHIIACIHRRGRRNRRGCAPRLNHGKVALYQLSYSRYVLRIIFHRRGRRNRRG